MSALRRSSRPRGSEVSPAPSSDVGSTPPRHSRRSAVRARAALRAPAPDLTDSPPKQSSASSEAEAEAEGEEAEQDPSADEGRTFSQPRSQSRRTTARSKRRAPPARSGRNKRRATEVEVAAPEPAPEPGEGEAEEGSVEEEEEEQELDEDGKPPLPSDPEGDKKVSPTGVLQGGRQLRCAVLTFPERGDHEFVLTRDAARTLEYRDANYFTKLHKILRIVRLTPEEKEMLVQLDMLKPHLKNRPITAVYARDLFQRFGARIVVDGKYVEDDYYEDRALADGAVSGEIAVPLSRDRQRDEYRKRVRAAKAQARLAEEEDTPAAGDESGSEAVEPGTSHAAQLREMYEKREREKEREKQRRRLVSSSHTHLSPSGEAVTTIFGDAGADPWSRTGPGVGKNTSRKAALHRDGIDERNWVLRFALAAAASARTHGLARRKGRVLLPVPPSEKERGEVNSLPAPRKEEAQDLSLSSPPIESVSDEDDEEQPTGVYEPGTNRVHVPASTQATWAQWRRVSSLPHIPGLEPEGDRRLPSLGEVPPLPSRAWGVMSVHTSAVLPEAESEARRWGLDVAER